MEGLIKSRFLRTGKASPINYKTTIARVEFEAALGFISKPLQVLIGHTNINYSMPSFPVSFYPIHPKEQVLS